MASLPQLLHPCCRCYCATAHCATPHCAPPCCRLCSQCQRCSLIHARRTMLVPPFSSPCHSPAPPLILLPPQPPHCYMGGDKDVPLVVIKIDGGGCGVAGNGGRENVPATPSPFVVATSWVVNDAINKSAGWRCGGSGGGRGDGREGVDNIAQ